MKTKHSRELAKPSGGSGQTVLMVCCLIAITLIVYGQTVIFDFVNYDDASYASENPKVLAGLTSPGLRWAFTTSLMGHWHPLTWISLMADGQATKWAAERNLRCGNERAGIFHMTNVVLHTANVLLLFFLLNSMTRMPWRSAFVAALFAAHPLHVESVAWVSERKDVLSTLFWLLTMLAYVRYVARPTVNRYALMALVFVLGLMSKSMLMTLPVTLLLMDFWPLGRIASAREKKSSDTHGRSLKYLIIEKLPLLGLALCASCMAFMAQRTGGTVVPFEWLPLDQRLTNALVSYGAYVLKMVWPVQLAVLYPIRRVIPTWEITLAAVFLLGATVIAVRSIRTTSLRWLPVGWFWYLITLLPVAGLVQIGAEALADHRMYVPFIGLYIIVAWGVPMVIERLMGTSTARTAVLAVPAGLVIIGLAWQAHAQVGCWRNGVTLFEQTLKVTKDNPIAELNYASALADASYPDEALQHYRNAIELRPRYGEAYLGLGTVLAEMNKFTEAEPCLRRAVELLPKSVQARSNLGAILLAQRKLPEAVEQLQEALRMDPRDQNARGNLEIARRMLGEE